MYSHYLLEESIDSIISLLSELVPACINQISVVRVTLLFQKYKHKQIYTYTYKLTFNKKIIKLLDSYSNKYSQISY